MKLPLELETTQETLTSISGETAADRFKVPTYIGWSETEYDELAHYQTDMALPLSPERAARIMKARAVILAKARTAKHERERTAQEIARLKNAGAVDALIEMLRVKPQHHGIMTTLAEMNATSALPVMIQAMAIRGSHWGPFGVKDVQCTAIASFGAATTPHFLDLLQLGDEDERRLLVELLAEVSDPDAAGPLLRLLEQGTNEVFPWAATALGLLGAETTLPALLRCIGDAALPYDRRRAAATAVRLIEHDRLRRALKSRVKAALGFDKSVQDADRSQWERISGEIMDVLGTLAERYRVTDMWLSSEAWGLVYLICKNPEEQWELLTDHDDRHERGYPTKEEGVGSLLLIYEEDRITRLMLEMLRVWRRTDMDDDYRWVRLPSGRCETRLAPHPSWEAQCAEFPSLA